MVRATVWAGGSLLGGVVFLALLDLWRFADVPAWAAVVAVIGTLLSGDLAERAWEQRPWRNRPDGRHGNGGDGIGRHAPGRRTPSHPS